MPMDPKCAPLPVLARAPLVTHTKWTTCGENTQHPDRKTNRC